MSRYTVWSVGRDGNVVAEVSYEIPGFALARLLDLQARYGRTRTVGITDNEYPESGDVSDRLAEEVSK